MRREDPKEKAGRRAAEAHQRREFGKASVLWEAYLELAPEEAGARANRAVCLLNNGEPEEALAEARRAYAQQPDAEGTATTLLESLDANGLTAELKEKAESFSKEFPGSSTAWFHRGKLAFWDGEYEEAAKHLHKAVEVRSKFFLAWWMLGESRMRLGRYSEAFAAFGQAQATHRDYPTLKEAEFRALEGMGRALLLIGRPDRALILAQQAEHLNIDVAEVQGLKARCKFRLGENDAVQVAESALDLGFHNEHLKALLAGAYASQGLSEKARELLGETAPDLDDVGTRHKRVGVLLQLGDTDKAEEELYELKDRLEPYVFLNSLAAMYRRNGNLEKAEEMSRKALQENRDPATVGNLALLYNELERFDEAEPLFKEAHQMAPEDPGFLVHLGYCHSMLGKKASARKELRKASASWQLGHHLKSLADELLGRIGNEEELKERYKAEGKSLFPIEAVEGYQQLNRDYMTERFEAECCRIAREEFGWSDIQQRKKLSRAGKTKKPDIYGTRQAREGNKVVCLGECKMKGSQLVNHGDMVKFIGRLELARDIEQDGEGREVEGYFFTNTGYDQEAKELAREQGIITYLTHITGNPQKNAEWRVSSLEESVSSSGP